MKRKIAYRDGIEMWTEGEVFEAPGGEVIEVLYTKQVGGRKVFFAELQGEPACAHGETVEEAIEEALLKRDGSKPLTEEEKKKYSAENFKFSPSLFKRITGACNAGVNAWLEERGLDRSVKMTIQEFKDAGGGAWAKKLESMVMDVK